MSAISPAKQEKANKRKKEIEDSFVRDLGDFPKPDSEEISDIKSAIENEETIFVSPKQISSNENIRRKIEKNKEFEQLVLSISENGLMQNLVVEFRQLDSEKYDLVCIAGHRRLAALRQLDYRKEIPVKVISPKRKGATKSLALSENVNRQNLHFIELADTYATLKFEGMSEEDIAKRFDKGVTTVKRYIKMANWNEEIKGLIFENKAEFGIKYIWDNFVVKKKTQGQILTALKTKLKKSSQIEDTPDSQKPKQPPKVKRALKLKQFYKEKKVAPSVQKRIEEALNFLGLM